MVSTRASTRASSIEPDSPLAAKSKRSPQSSSSSSTAVAPWSHKPTTVTLIWMAISLPLVIWDTGYVLGRPHTMPGGAWHAPIWSPYKLYGEVDYVYGWKAFNDGDGFTSAQGMLNVIETLLYFVYMWLWHANGTEQLPKGAKKGSVQPQKKVDGKVGALCALVGFSAALMTLSKTLLYALHEHYSGWSNVGHNSALDLTLLYIIPNGAWIVGSTYMTWSIGNEILDGLAIAGSPKTKAA